MFRVIFWILIGSARIVVKLVFTLRYYESGRLLIGSVLRLVLKVLYDKNVAGLQIQVGNSLCVQILQSPKQLRRNHSNYAYV